MDALKAAFEFGLELLVSFANPVQFFGVALLVEILELKICYCNTYVFNCLCFQNLELLLSLIC